MLLQVKNLNFAYGDVQALWDINLEVGKGEVVALVGSNGAGKSTLLKNISGLLRPRKGSQIIFDGEDITNTTADVRVRKGIALVPEGRQLFAGLTIRENLMMGAFTRSDVKAIQEDLERIFALFPILEERQAQLAGTLSGGEQQMCAIARGLMSNPKLLMIDELSLGLAPVVVDRLMETIQTIHDNGVTVFLVEQDVQAAFQMSERGYVLETGHLVHSGNSRDLMEDEAIKKAYLGI
ncbi:MAG TPA: ABC transporter ATP-binding protein [Chloroflexi bacterium]|jgi:branched-chain amino acid transport system ATP-binding protein|nr:ABC transporter ATP-binding protein [Chloroflexota bacterium]